MSEIFEYALIRVVPRIDRGESINVGVLVYSKSFRYLKARIELNENRLRALDPGADVEAVRGALRAFGRACTEGPLAEQSPGERFRWLTAPRSAIVQPGPVHAGITGDPDADLDRLFSTLVAS
ncbi:MAG: hypothetical protein JWO75_6502 [Actinomycetia bacterium]|jgi:hypothetical protein|nr:hypothetical protein [Actinomycetes bacterium]